MVWPRMKLAGKTRDQMEPLGHAKVCRDASRTARPLAVSRARILSHFFFLFFWSLQAVSANILGTPGSGAGRLVTVGDIIR